MIARKTHRRYENVKDYEFFDKDGKSCGLFQTNELTEDLEKEELKDLMALSGAVKVIMIWTARGGKCHKEVNI